MTTDSLAIMPMQASTSSAVTIDTLAALAKDTSTGFRPRIKKGLCRLRAKFSRGDRALAAAGLYRNHRHYDTLKWVPDEILSHLLLNPDNHYSTHPWDEEVENIPCVTEGKSQAPCPACFSLIELTTQLPAYRDLESLPPYNDTH